MIVSAAIFWRIAQLSSDGIAPYALTVFAGMLHCAFFSTELAKASNSLIAQVIPKLELCSVFTANRKD
jgi:ABC-type polysaccharide/polyol phosphate export permease